MSQTVKSPLQQDARGPASALFNKAPASKNESKQNILVYTNIKLTYTKSSVGKGLVMFIHKLCTALAQAKIPYAVVGGYAVALHGAVRGTVDVDIVIKWSLKNLQKVESVLKQLGLVSLHPVDADSVFRFRDEYIQNRNLIAWNFYDPADRANQVNVIITYDLTDASIRTIITPSGSLKVLSLHDLIKMKKASGSPQDLLDADALESL